MRFIVLLLYLSAVAATAQVSDADDAFAQEVRYRAQLDQIVRDLPDVRFAPGTPRDSMDANTAGLWIAVDSLNAEWARGVLATRGWPKTSEVGARAGFDFWAIVQHTDLPTWRTAAPLMEAAVAEGEADSGEFALLVDRIRMREGRPQVFGSQIRMVDGEPVPYHIEDVDGLDARRAAVGLEPMEEYLDSFRNHDSHSHH